MMEQKVYHSFEEVLEKEGVLIYENVGDSMEPLIHQGRDRMIIARKPEGRLKRLDVPLYRRDNGTYYVLHRILWVRNNDYIISGDNRWNLETGITDRHIIGVLTGLVRGDKIIDLHKSWRYKLYVHLWCDFFPIRAFLLLLKRLVLGHP